MEHHLPHRSPPEREQLRKGVLGAVTWQRFGWRGRWPATPYASRSPSGCQISVFNGPPPAIALHPDEEAETQPVSTWLAARAAEGESPETMGAFVRSPSELPRAVRAVERAGLHAGLLDERASVPAGRVSVGTMPPISHDDANTPVGAGGGRP